jgi:hypothetical protein
MGSPAMARAFKVINDFVSSPEKEMLFSQPFKINNKNRQKIHFITKTDMNN